MKTVTSVLLGSILLHATTCSGDEVALQRIAFGSCIQEQNPAPLLKTIVDAQPDLMIMLGDNIYADTADMDVMRAKYAKLQQDAGFQKLRAACPLLATWDDHDYGRNDAGADYQQKVASQRIFVDFWGDAADSARRQRPGVYDARIFGPPGKRVQVILLDTRYFRSPLATGKRRVGGPYYPDDSPTKTMLGETQWRWLREQLRRPAELRVVASSIQLVAESAGQETWSNLPQQRERFLKLIAETQANGVLVLSGDRHWAEISRTTEHVHYPLYDVTSSSINQIHSRGTPTQNRHRVSSSTFHRENFGLITVDWSEQPPRIEVSIRDLENQSQIVQRLTLAELRRSGKID